MRTKLTGAMFEVVSCCSGSGARLGSLCGGKIPTPNCLGLTRSGKPPHLTGDTIRDNFPGAKAWYVTLPDFLTNPGTAALKRMPARSDGSGESTLHDFLNVRDDVLFLGVRCTEGDEVGPANKNSLAVWTPEGRRRITPEDFMDAVHIMKPDLFVTLADEIPATSTRNRTSKSVVRSLEWLDQCIALHKASSPAAQQSHLFASVGGANDLPNRQRAAHEIVKRGDDVSGFLLAGFGTGESPQQRQDILDDILPVLPARKPRLISGQGNPLEILDCVSRGVDLFDSSYTNTLTANGYLATFRIDFEDDSQSSSSSHDGDSTKMNLREPRFARDQSPLKPGCPCYSCTNFSRAYINHLFNAHEMAGEVLLHICNTHHFESFFSKIRTTIADGTFEQWRSQFEASFTNLDCGPLDKRPERPQRSEGFKAALRRRRERQEQLKQSRS